MATKKYNLRDSNTDKIKSSNIVQGNNTLETIMNNVLVSVFENNISITTSYTTLNTITIPRNGNYLCLVKSYDVQTNVGEYLESRLFRNGSSIKAAVARTQNGMASNVFFYYGNFSKGDVLTHRIKTSNGTLATGWVTGDLVIIQLN